LRQSVLGKSVQGQDIHGYFFGNSDPAQLDTLFFGAFHGDEGISTQLLDRLIQAWQQQKWAHQAINFEQTPVLIVPILNPDGLKVENRVNANQVDLNRNYPTEEISPWEELNENTIYYSGKTPASEPETQLVIDLLERYKPKKIVTVHSPYKVVNFDGPAEGLANAIGETCGYPVVADIGYPTPGSFGTYAGKIRNIPVITLELPEDESLEQVWADNAAAMEVAVHFKA
jgi:murein peptide amidase A